MCVLGEGVNVPLVGNALMPPFPRLLLDRTNQCSVAVTSQEELKHLLFLESGSQKNHCKRLVQV